MIGVLRIGAPIDPQPGDMWLEAVLDILTSWQSCDFGFTYEDGYLDEPAQPCWDWGSLLEYKRADLNYADVRDSIRDRGWFRPVCVQFDGTIWEFGDGHHRLAAAVELGHRYIPVQLMRYSFSSPYTAADAYATWSYDTPIQRENSYHENHHYQRANLPELVNVPRF
jgi:hypothetical protein